MPPERGRADAYRRARPSGGDFAEEDCKIRSGAGHSPARHRCAHEDHVVRGVAAPVERVELLGHAMPPSERRNAMTTQ